jgi:hypothetical protein
MKVFSIRPKPDGSIVVGASRPDHSGPCQLAGTEAQIDGTLVVTVDRGVEVLSHNAQGQLSTGGVFGGYTWSIKSPNADPFLVIRPADTTLLGVGLRSHPNFPERRG